MCTEEEHAKLGDFYPTRNIQEGGFIARYSIPSMGDEALLGLHRAAASRLEAARGDLGAIKAEMAQRHLGEFGANIINSEWQGDGSGI